MTTGNAHTFRGRVVSVGQTERLGKDPNKPFRKRTAIIDDSEPGAKYQNPVQFEAIGDYCAMLDQLVVGAAVEVSFYLNGREWKDQQGRTRYFCSNRIVKVASGDASNANEVPEPAEPDDSIATGDGYDMPF